MIENRFLYFDTKEKFLEKAGEQHDIPNLLYYEEIYGDSIVFIKDTKQIWTHGVYLDCVYSKDSLKYAALSFPSNFYTYSDTLISEFEFKTLNTLYFNITKFDASLITDGTLDPNRLPSIPLDKIPHGALERLYIVADEQAALNNSEITEGDTIKRMDTNKMYFCIANSGSFEDRFMEYTAGGATAIDWSNILNKPTFATVATSGSYNDLIDKPLIDSLPSNLILGYGQENALAVFSGSNNLKAGAVLDTTTSYKFLNKKGEWAVPTNIISNLNGFVIPLQGTSDIGGMDYVDVNIPNTNTAIEYIMMYKIVGMLTPTVTSAVIGIHKNISTEDDMYMLYDNSPVQIEVNVQRLNNNVVRFNSIVTGISTISNNKYIQVYALIPIR